MRSMNGPRFTRGSRSPSERRLNMGRADVRDLPVASVMASPVVTVDATSPVPLALQHFTGYAIRHLVVVDSDGHAVGLLTDRMVVSRWASHPETFDRTMVGALLTGDQPFVAVADTLSGAARAMRHGGVDGVVVLDTEGRPVGVLTTSDLVAVIAKPHLH